MLIIDGDDDEIVPIDASAMLSFKLIKNTQHGMCTTLKDQVNEDLLAFIRALIMNAGCDCD